MDTPITPSPCEWEQNQSKTVSSPDRSVKALAEEVELRAKLKEFLRQRPGNLSAAGRELGLSRRQVKALVDEFQDEFAEIEDEYLDDLEEKVFQTARGHILSEGFSFNEAVKILAMKRPDNWGKAPAGKKQKNPAARYLSDATKSLING